MDKTDKTVSAANSGRSISSVESDLSRLGHDHAENILNQSVKRSRSKKQTTKQTSIGSAPGGCSLLDLVMKYRARLATLFDCGGDLSRQWFIEYYAFNPATGISERKRDYRGLGRLKTAPERYLFAQVRIKELNEKLLAGWTPFSREQYLPLEHPAEQELPEKKDFQFYFRQFIADKKLELKPRSIGSYTSMFKVFLNWLTLHRMHQRHPGRLSDQQAREFLRWISLERKASNKTRNIYHTVMKLYYNWLRAEKAVTENPFNSVKQLQVQRKVKVTYTPEQVKKLEMILEEKDPYLWLHTRMVYYCFFRNRSELIEMRVRHIDFNSRTIQLDSSIAKNNKAQAVTIPDALYDLLIKMNIHRYPGDYYLFTTKGPPGPRRTGKNTYGARFRKILDDLGYPPGVNIYNFKHTGNKRLAVMKIPMRFIQLQNRHHSIQQTAEYLSDMHVTECDEIISEFPRY